MSWAQVTESSDTWTQVDTFRPNAVKLNEAQLFATAIDGQADSTKVTSSVWYRLEEGEPDGIIYFWSTRLAPSSQFTLSSSNNRLSFFSDQLGFPSTRVAFFAASESFLTTGVWHHVAFSIDAEAEVGHFRFDGESVSATLNVINSTMDFTPDTGSFLGQWRIGSNSQARLTSRIQGSLSEVWISPGVYIDLDTYPQTFRSSEGFPVRLGQFGATATDETALIYLTGNAKNWTKNSGVGSDFEGIDQGVPTDTDGPGPAGSPLAAWRAQSEDSSGWT